MSGGMAPHQHFILENRLATDFYCFDFYNISRVSHPSFFVIDLCAWLLFCHNYLGREGDVKYEINKSLREILQ